MGTTAPTMASAYGPGKRPGADVVAAQETRERTEALYREHFGFIYRSVRRLGVRESSLEDAVQDVFVVAFRKLDGFEGRSSLRGWLFGIATRVAAEHRRRDARIRLDNDAQAGVAAWGETLIELRGQVQQLDRLLAMLNSDQREVFIMADVEGFEAPEIADALGLKLNTVYSRLRLGRRRFQRALSQWRSKLTREGAR